MVNNMEITIISRDTIKPSAESVNHLSPYNLSLVDQLTPATYMPLILFYSISDHPNSSFNLQGLKKSLTETLTLYYPVSGRAKKNRYIHDFDSGVPFLEARVNCRMLEFLELQETLLLNNFLPFAPMCRETHEDLPLMSFQVSVFACGGVAIGASTSHKLGDGLAVNNIIESWAAIFRGERDKIIQPNFESSLLVPPRDPLDAKYLYIADRLWFKEDDYVSRRFLFSDKAIDTLQQCSSESSPIILVSCFIWKHAMASRAKSPGTSPITSIVAHATNMRTRLDMMGNFFWWGTTVTDSSKLEKAHELCDLVNLVNESLKGFDRGYLESLQGEEGFVAIKKFYDKLEGMLSSEPEVYLFVDWTKIYGKLDFGWGKPFWEGLVGKVGPAFRNITVFMKAQCGSGIEAWVTLKDKQMAALEEDPEFLAIASPNMGITRT